MHGMLLQVMLRPSMTLTYGITTLLHKARIDRTFSQNDFDFTIAGEVFKELLFLVDGIYPPLSHFVHPMTVSIDVDEALLYKI
jgi:hypothetical protein